MAVIAVDCGGTNVAYGRVAAPGRVPEASGAVPTPGHAHAIPDAIVDAVGPLVDTGVTGIGIGVAGLVDHETGTLVWMPHATGDHVPIGTAVARRLGIPTAVDNDANVAALAEARLGSGAGARMVLMVTVGTGIGVGLAIDGRIERGRGHLGEAGHMTLDPDGPGCACGRRGCWEAFVSGGTLGAAARRRAAADPDGPVAGAAGGAPPAGEHLLAAAAAGDADARADLVEAGRWLGMGISGLVALLDPDVVVVGGGVAGAGELLLGPARKAMMDMLPGAAHRAPTPVVPARFGAESGLVGAGMIAKELV